MEEIPLDVVQLAARHSLGHLVTIRTFGRPFVSGLMIMLIGVA